MAEHTPGPWKVKVGSRLIEVVAGNAFGICHVLRNTDGAARTDSLALNDARLIAAAPDLLGALEQVEWTNAVDGGAICPWCGGRRYDGHYNDCPRQLALAMARGDDPD